MKNLITIHIANNTGIEDTALYVFIADGDNNFYKLDAANNWVATAQTTACNVLLNSIPSANGLYTFYLNSDNSMTGGRIWFTTSATALSVSTNGIIQPPALADYVFDFVELAITPTTTSPSGATTLGNANIDTSQVDSLGIPITVYVNPTENGLQFPPPLTGIDTSKLNYPNVIGIQPWRSLDKIISDFTTNLTGTPYTPFSACGWSSGTVKRLVAPFHLIDNYTSGTTPTTLATFLDEAIYSFFKYYMGKTLTLQDPVSLNYYDGTVTTVTATDTTGGTSTYNVLQFTGSGETYNVYFPYFTTNCAALPGVLTTGVALSPPPTWWTGNLPTTMPATAMALACAGTFSDYKYQTGVSNSNLLGNLENQVVSLITRGMSPVINNLISFKTQFSAADIVNNQVSITSLPSGEVITTSMKIVKQMAAQPTDIVSAVVENGNTKQIIITDPVGNILPVPECLFICGEFYPQNTTSAGYSNMYSNYLHYGLGTSPAPLLNNIGYGFAFDDQGGYSNDVTATYNSDNALTVGIFLGPLKKVEIE